MEEKSLGGPSKWHKCRKKSWSLVGFIPLVLVLSLYWSDSLLLEYEALFGYGQAKDYGLPSQLMEQFRMYDTNADGFIDPDEFSFLQHHLDQVDIARGSIT